MSMGEATMGVREFADAAGIGYRAALDIVHSSARPPGFWAGNRYRVSREGLGEWMRAQARNEKAPRW